MVSLGSQRRAARRSLRTVEELDSASRARLRGLLTNSCLVVLPTSSAVGLVTTRLAPGSVTIGVASSPGLGIDQTVAVTDVLAARGYDARPHLVASDVESPRHLERILRQLRGVGSVLLVPGVQPTLGHLLQEVATAIRQQHDTLRLGVAVAAESGEDAAQAVLEAAAAADWISTRSAVDGRRLAAWAAEMRIRGLEPPIELGVPGTVRFDALEREEPVVAAAAHGGRRRSQWYDPTTLVSTIAQEHSLDRLGITGLRIDTLNFLDETATWRQRLFDLAAPVKEP